MSTTSSSSQSELPPDNFEYHWLLKWLTPVAHHAHQDNFAQKQHLGSLRWFFESPSYRHWVHETPHEPSADGEPLTPSRTLFCSGAPGVGKSVLASAVIRDLGLRFSSDHHPSKISVAYVYCVFNLPEENSAANLLLVLFQQLLPPSCLIPRNLPSWRYGDAPSPARIMKSLQSVVREHYHQVFIVLDALDECDASQRAEFLAQIFDLQKTQGSVQLLATSNLDPEVAALFAGADSVKIQSDQEDQRSHLRWRMGQLPAFVRDQPSLQNKVIEAIVGASERRFLLAELYFQCIAGKHSADAIGRTIAEFSGPNNGHDQAYETLMIRINDQGEPQASLARRSLSFIIHASRPLTVSELRHLLAVGAGDGLLDPQNAPTIQVILAACAGLVTVAGHWEDDTGEPDAAAPVRLRHRTTYEYHERTRRRWFPDGEEQIMAACVAYLSLPCFSEGLCATPSELESRLRACPLYRYAALQWGHHAKLALSNSPAQVVFRYGFGFLTSRPHIEAACQVLFVAENQEDKIQGDKHRDFPHRMTGLHLAGYFGLDSLVSALCAEYASRSDGVGEQFKASILNAKDSHGRTAVSWAAQQGHLETVKAVLQQGGTLADFDSRDREGRTSLSLATEHGHIAIAEALLASGADANLKSVSGATPLWYAVERRGLAMARLLLAFGARPSEPGKRNLSDEGPHSPIWLAVREGHDEMVRLLLNQPSIQLRKEEVRGSSCKCTLLWLATKGKHATIVEMLLSHAIMMGAGTAEAMMTETEGYEESPLYLAATIGDEKITRLLLQSGAEVNVRTYFDKNTPLYAAVRHGHDRVAALLLSHDGILPHVENQYGSTPIFCAVEWGRTEILPQLLSAMKDSPEHVRAKTYTILLHEAARQGNLAALELLLALEGLDVDARNPKGRTALSLAVRPDWNLRTQNAPHERDYAGIVRRLIESGRVNVNSRDNEGKTPLAHAAGDRDGLVSLQLLLSNSMIELNTVDKRGSTPLSEAVICRGEQNLALLLQYGADPTLGTCWGDTTLLFYATKEKDLMALNTLLADKRIDPGQCNKDGHTALCEAAENGWTAGVEAFLAKEGVDFGSRCDDGLTLLHHAARNWGYGATEKKEKEMEKDIASLLERGHLQINAQDNRGMTALHHAIESNTSKSAAMILVVKGVDLNVRDATGRIPLQYAMKTMDKAVVSVLFEAGDGDSNVRDPGGRTLLAIAAESGSPDIVDWALSLDGVVVNARDNTGRTPLSLAAQRRHGGKVLKRLLRTEGVEINAEDEMGWTPLFWATKVGGVYPALQILLEEGARVEINHLDRWGRTPLALAWEQGDEVATKMLQRAGGRTPDPSVSREAQQPDTIVEANEPRNMGQRSESMPQGREPESIPARDDRDNREDERRRWMEPDWFRHDRPEESTFSFAAAMRFDEEYHCQRRRFGNRGAHVQIAVAAEECGYDVWQPHDQPDQDRLCEHCSGLDLGILTSDAFSWTKKPVVLSRIAEVDKSWASRDCGFCRLLSTIAPRDAKPAYAAEWELCAYSSTASWLSRANRKAKWDLDIILADTMILGLEYPGSEYFSRTHPPRSRSSGRESPDYLLEDPSAILPFGFIGQVRPDNVGTSLRSLQFHALRADAIDFDRARGWIDCCATHHGKRCNPDSHGPRQRIPHFRVIDCTTRSVVDSFSGNDQFVALSYVWGPPVEQGGFNDHSRVGKAERVVEDAIRVSTALGYKYLWVDRHCIVQDSADIRQKQLLAMNKVYENAEVTIVVAAGQDSSFGIPGVSSARSRLQQPSARVHGHVLATVPREPCDIVRRSIWWTRGWTFQEGLLSRRLLMFTQHEVSYECQAMVARESVGLPTSVHRFAATRYPLHEHSRVFPRKSARIESGFIWSRIEEYTQRHLTHDSDILNAMLGIMNTFARQEPPIYHVCGIPLTFDEWNPHGQKTTQTPLEQFARSLCWTLGEPGCRREGFPSWSWTGWKGVVSRPQGYDMALELGFPIDVSLVPQDPSSPTLTWAAFEALGGDTKAALPQHYSLQITSLTIPVRIYGGAHKGDWRAVLYNDDDALAVSLELCKSPMEYPEFARRLLEDEWLAVVIGYSSTNGHNNDNHFTLLLLDKLSGDKWERVGVLKIYHEQIPDTTKGGCVKRTLLVA